MLKVFIVVTDLNLFVWELIQSKISLKNSMVFNFYFRLCLEGICLYLNFISSTVIKNANRRKNEGQKDNQNYLPLLEWAASFVSVVSLELRDEPFQRVNSYKHLKLTRVDGGLVNRLPTYLVVNTKDLVTYSLSANF